MPKTKDPFARYQRINEILQTRTSAKAVVKAEALAEMLDISLRQLRIDMEHLRGMGAPLQYDPVMKGWRYPPGSYFTILDRLPMSGEDLTCLRIAVETVAKINRLKGFEQLPEVFGKIHQAAKKWVAKDGKVLGKAVYFDPLPEYDGGKHLPFFLEAVDAQRRVRFRYRSFRLDDPGKTVVFDPWFLRHYDRRWYVGGFSHDPSENFVRVFPLERIEGAPEAVGYCHDKPKGYDAESYWRYVYGITVPPGGQVESVELRFAHPQDKYFESSPFFVPFEVLERGPEHLTVRLRLMPNVDLERRLAGYGPNVKVLQPQWLAERLRDFHAAAAKQYG